MTFKRYTRMLICFVLICALLINVSPIRAKAVLIELTTAELVRLGLVALASLMVCGVYYNIQHQNQLEALGRSFHTTLYESTNTEEEVEILDVWLGSIWVDDLVVSWPGAKEAAGGFLTAALTTLLTNNFAGTPEPIKVSAAKFFTSRTPYTSYRGITIVPQSDYFTFKANFIDESSSSHRYFEFVIIRGTTSYQYDGSIKTCSKLTLDGVTYGVWTDFNRSTAVDPQLMSGSTYIGSVSKGDYKDISLAVAAIMVPKYLDGTFPTYDMIPSHYDSEIMEEFNSGNVQTLDIPDIDLSQTTQEELIEMANKVISGEMTHQEVLDRLTGGQTIVVIPSIPEVDTGTDTDPSESTEPTVPIDPGPGTGTDPDSNPDGDSAELTWWERFTKWFQDLRTAINELPNRFDEHFENLNNNVNEVPNKFESWIQGVQSSVDSVAESILGSAEDINAAIQGLPNTFMGHFSVIVDAIAAVPQAILSGLQNLFLSLFSPSADFMESKVTALKEKYPFVDTFSSLGVTFKSFFQNIGSKPPIIWIDLGAGSAWFPMGGRVKFLDLSWYSEFKPLMDNISGGFLWLWTGWRLFQSAPGIISGASGMFGQARTEHERSFRRKDSKEG